MAQPTLLDLSRRLGVSTFTVSRALAGKPGVGDATRERVVAAARRVGYVPNAVAATLKGQRSRAVGVMTASGRNQYYAMLVQAIDGVLQRHGLHAVTNDAMRGRQYDQALQRQSVDALLQQRVGAVVATYPLSRDSLERLERWKVPLLFVDALPPRGAGAYRSVGGDDRAAGRLVARHFASLGCRDVAVLAYPKDWNTRAPRERGFRDAARRLGIRVATIEADNSFEAAFDAALDYLERGAAPDAIYALNTPMLQGALRATRAAGLRVPDDIGLLGFDDFDWAEFVDPPMTVVDQHIAEIGRLAGEQLVAMLSPPPSTPPSLPARVTVQPTLVVRQSCRSRSSPGRPTETGRGPAKAEAT